MEQARVKLRVQQSIGYVVLNAPENRNVLSTQSHCMTLPDHREGVAAFFGKRKPRFGAGD